MSKKTFRSKPLLLLFPLLILVSSACSVLIDETRSDAEIFIREEQSWFSDFVVSEKIVTLKCHVCIENSTKETQTVCLLANFQEDVQTGLIKEAELLATSQNAPSNLLFLLQPGTNNFDIYFMGTFNGNFIKNDRMLPDIRIIKVIGDKKADAGTD